MDRCHEWRAAGEAEQDFDVLVTADQKLPHQQQPGGRRLAVVVLPTNRVFDVVRLLPDATRAVDSRSAVNYEQDSQCCTCSRRAEPSPEPGAYHPTRSLTAHV